VTHAVGEKEFKEGAGRRVDSNDTQGGRELPPQVAVNSGSERVHNHCQDGRGGAKKKMRIGGRLADEQSKKRRGKIWKTSRRSLRKLKRIASGIVGRPIRDPGGGSSRRELVKGAGIVPMPLLGCEWKKWEKKRGNFRGGSRKRAKNEALLDLSLGLYWLVRVGASAGGASWEGTAIKQVDAANGREENIGQNSKNSRGYG